MRLDENKEYPVVEWNLQLCSLTVKCLAREDVLAFTQIYADLSVQGLAWLWLRLTYKHTLDLRHKLLEERWQARVNERVS